MFDNVQKLQQEILLKMLDDVHKTIYRIQARGEWQANILTPNPQTALILQKSLNQGNYVTVEDRYLKIRLV